MFKFIVLAMVVAAANAGVIGLGGLGHGVAIAAPVAIAHGAESWQNNNQISVHPVPVVAQVKTIAHAPIAVAHAPVAVAAPVAIGIGHGGLGLGLGGHGLGGLGLGGLGLGGLH